MFFLIGRVILTVPATLCNRHRLGLLLAALVTLSAHGGEVNLYTDRQELFLRETLAAFTQKTGHKVNTLFVKKGLLERTQAEGEASPADVFLIADIGRLSDFVEAGLTAPLASPQLQQIPPTLRDKNNHWFAVTRRARALIVRPDETITRYEDLAAPTYRGALCLRSGAHPYNNALFADMIARLGTAHARKWLQAVKNNLAHPPHGKDRTQINKVAGGECRIGVANSYYYFHLLNNANAERRRLLQDKTKLIIPQQAHINITGMARARYGKNPQEARQLMEFLLGKKAQTLLATRNFEFPARNDIDYPPVLAPYRRLIEQAAPLLQKTAHWRRTASQLVDEIGFDR